MRAGLAIHGRRLDWFVALTPAVLAGVVYACSTPPSVTISSGAYITASYGFGVPITPGYPLWTLAGYLWSHFIFPVGNPAWRISMMSVVAGAALVGVLALTMWRTTLCLFDALPWAEAIDLRQRQWIAIPVAVSTALTFGFNRTIWQWACMPEPPALYTLIYMLAVFSFITWLRDPRRRRRLYLTLFLLSCTVATADFNALPIAAVMASPFFVGVLVKGSRKALPRVVVVTQQSRIGWAFLKALPGANGPFSKTER